MVREGSVPNTREIGRGVQLANENPARQIGVALESTDDDSGRIDAVLRVADENPRRATLFADNTGSSQTGFLRAGAGFQHANVGGRDHVLNLQYVTAPANPSKVTILGAGYHVPLYALKASLDFIAGYSDVDSGTVAGLFTVSGSGQVYAVRYNQTLPRYEGYDHKLVLGWDYRAFRQNVSLVGTTGTLVPDITVQPLSLSYSGRLSQAGSDLGGSVSIARNLPGGTDGGQNAFTAQRAGAKAAYTVLRYGLSYSRAIGQEMILRASFSGQYSNDLLVSGEQFGMGGADSVRGFFEREAANDRGQRASVELYGPDLGKTTFGGDWKARLLAFADSAWGRDNVPERGGKNGLSSVGIGLRMSEGKRWSIRADVALATNGVATRPDSSGRVHLGVAYGF
jgi:hemolysin activation/secretion protein